MPLDPETMGLMRLVEGARYPEVEIAARRILDKRSRHPLAMKALGFSLIGQKRFEEALPIVEFAIEHYPQDPELHNNRGIALSMLMRWDESLTAFNRSLALQPDDPETLKNLGVAYFRMHRWNEAVPPLLKAIECHPDDFEEAVVALADTLLNANRVDEAWTCYKELWLSNKKDFGALSMLISASLRRCDWADLREHLAILRRDSRDFSGLSVSPFAALAWPGVNSSELRRIAENFARTQIPAQFLEEKMPEFSTLQALQGGRLRIGYFSADFRNHPVGQVMAELIERHDRNRVEVFGYSLGVDDGSPLRARLAQGFEHFTDLAGVSVVETARAIRADDIHILVDLHGWTSDGRPEALALRCAPLQVNWLGYAGTIGHARLADYVIGDDVVTPLDKADCYTETIANLPWSYMPVDTTVLPAPAPSRAEAGLPEAGFVFCSFNNSYKFNPDVFDLWARILLACPDSLLWLSQPSGGAKDHLRQELISRGVGEQRLVFAPRVERREDHLGRLQLADLALDPFPYNSHSTGGDALLAGVPMISLVGETFPSRVGASLLRAAGLEELAMPSQEAYFEMAATLYRNPDRVRQLKSRLQGHRSLPFFDMAGLASALEELYSRMWADHAAGRRRPLAIERNGC